MKTAATRPTPSIAHIDVVEFVAGTIAAHPSGVSVISRAASSDKGVSDHHLHYGTQLVLHCMFSGHAVICHAWLRLSAHFNETAYALGSGLIEMRQGRGLARSP